MTRSATALARRAPAPAPTPAIQDIVFAHIHDAVFATDLDNRVTYWSVSAERLFGYSSDEAVGRRFGDLLPYRMANAADEEGLFSVLLAGRTWRGTGSVRIRDGSTIWIESTVQPIIIDEQVTGSVSVSRDTTVAIESERRIIAQEQFVDAVLDAATALVVVLDTHGRIVRFNHACERLSGYLQEELLGRALWDVLLPEGEATFLQAVFSTPLRPGTFAHEGPWVTRSGSHRQLSWSISCLTDRAEAVTHVVFTGTDITDERRGIEALHGIEAIGRLLAAGGPTPDTLRAVVDELGDRMGYPLLELYLVDGDELRLGAQRGYLLAPARMAFGLGIIGRAGRTRLPQFVPDVASDPDYLEGDPTVSCEIAVPLLGEGETLGVLGIESSAAAPLTDADLRFATAVADRLATALLLGREQQALRERARLFAALTEFGATANAILDETALWAAIASAVASVVPADTTILMTLEHDSGRYLVRSVRGVDESVLGVEVRPGQGLAGRAILSRTIVVTGLLGRSSYSPSLRDAIHFEKLWIVSVPLIREGVVLGAINVGRALPSQGFSELEREVLVLLGSHAALALANANLMREVSELAIQDGLTGLHNRRYFDSALDRIIATHRRRIPPSSVAAIMFDLDHFGQFNRQNGHLAGDAGLRAFAGVLRERLRSADLAARYGGEEFVAILENCSVEEAARVAEEVRSGFEAVRIAGPNGQVLHATVSAGCAVLDENEPTKDQLLRNRRRRPVHGQARRPEQGRRRLAPSPPGTWRRSFVDRGRTWRRALARGGCRARHLRSLAGEAFRFGYRLADRRQRPCLRAPWRRPAAACPAAALRARRPGRPW